MAWTSVTYCMQQLHSLLEESLSNSLPCTFFFLSFGLCIHLLVDSRYCCYLQMFAMAACYVCFRLRALLGRGQGPFCRRLRRNPVVFMSRCVAVESGKVIESRSVWGWQLFSRGSEKDRRNGRKKHGKMCVCC